MVSSFFGWFSALASEDWHKLKVSQYWPRCQFSGWHWQRCECCRVTAECRGPTSTTTPPKVLQAEVSHLKEVLQPEVSLLTKVARNLSSTEVQLHPPAASPSNTSLTFHCFSSSTLPLSQQAAASCSLLPLELSICVPRQPLKITQ